MLDPKAFDYLQPTETQIALMADVREAFRLCAERVQTLVPDGPDLTYVLRHLRDAAMWANVAITRLPDGSARS